MDQWSTTRFMPLTGPPHYVPEKVIQQLYGNRFSLKLFLRVQLFVLWHMSLAFCLPVTRINAVVGVYGIHYMHMDMYM